MTGYVSKKAAARDKLVVTDIDGHIVRDVRKPKKAAARDKLVDDRRAYYEKFDDLYAVYLNGVYDGKKAAQRPWVELEGEKIRYLWEEATKPDRSTMAMVTSFAQAIDAALRIKNT